MKTALSTPFGLLVGGLGLISTAALTAGAAPPEIAAASPKAEQAIGSFQLAAGIQASLFAAEPRVAHPVAFCIDRQGQFLVCETFRVHHGVEDNRQHPEWIDDDLASRTVDDRLAMYQKHLGAEIGKFSQFEDRLRWVTDNDGDGQADKSQVFVDGFNDPLDGMGAGVYSRNGNVYYACIPSLWAFRDDDHDGVADRRLELAKGFGVHVSFLGHDLHGLCLGPDGRLYFSIGDRGYHVETTDGILSDSESGAIFRCELDGTGLEVFATGFRNPQELAFDEMGNLFTCDSSSTGGDQARWIHVLEGGDSGWRMPYQYLTGQGPWNRARLWLPAHEGQAAYICPPVANFADSPAGLAFYPGTGLPEYYRGNFFLCDLRTSANQSGIRTFKVKRRGASFEMIEPEIFLWNCRASDLAFGPNSALYVSDLVDGWEGPAKGRIYRLFDPRLAESQEVAEVQQVLAKGVRKTAAQQLAQLLEHPDLRIRRESQLELARRGKPDVLAHVAADSEIQVARIHAVWGLGQIARRGESDRSLSVLELVTEYLGDPDPEMRAAAAQVLGDSRYAPAAPQLIRLLREKDARVSYQAAQALGRISSKKATDDLISLLLANNDQDAAIRHACVMGLAGCASENQLVELATHPSPAARRGAVLALRRKSSSRIINFLTDDDPSIVLETARAIHDLPIGEALPALAAQIAKLTNPDEAFVLRVLNANFRLGTPQHAAQLTDYATRQTAPLRMRLEALQLLGQWESPPARDHVVGSWRPLPKRSSEALKSAFGKALPLLLGGDHLIRWNSANLAAAFGISEAGNILHKIIDDDARPGPDRASALFALKAVDDPRWAARVAACLKDSEPHLRAAARVILTQTDPDRGLPLMLQALAEGTLLEKRSALTTLGRATQAPATPAVLQQLKALAAGKVDKELALDVYVAARQQSHDPQIQKTLSKYEQARTTPETWTRFREVLHGGDASRGETLFFQQAALACASCHTIDGRGGELGPDLTDVARNQTRQELLQSLVDPEHTMAEGFEKDKPPQPGPTETAMPTDLVTRMTLFDLRDLVEFLANRNSS